MQGIILAAGDGSRLKQVTLYKPFLLLGNIRLLDYVLGHFLDTNVDNIYIHFNESERAMDLSKFQLIGDRRIKYGFLSTKSSFHTLNYAIRHGLSSFKDHVLVSMVDTILSKHDFERFIKFCETLKKNESAILVTSYIDDENPLTVTVGSDDVVTEFQIPKEKATVVTSGMYYFSPEIVPSLALAQEQDINKMRNFLSLLLKENHIIKAFHVAKTMDVDRPEDIDKAIHYIGEIN